MSDSESDWESDGDDATLPTQDASKPNASPTAANAATSPVAAGAVPSILHALPMTLSLKDHPQLGQGIPAGLTLLYDAPKNVITLLAYDPHKRPMLVEPFDGAKLPKPVLPFSLTVGDGEGNTTHQLVLTDSQQRKWTCSFAAPHEAARMVANIAVATVVAKAATATQMGQVFLKHDLSKGSGKSCKAGYFVSLQVRAWIVDLTTDLDAHATAAIGRVTGTQSWTAFNPDLTIGGQATAGTFPFTLPVLSQTVSDVEVPDESASAAAATSCPSTLSEALAGGKLKTEGGSRLLVVPASSDLAAEITRDAPLKRGGEGSLLVLQLTPLSVSKKREKKESKEKKGGSKSTSSVLKSPSSPTGDDASDSLPSFNTEKRVSFAYAPSAQDDLDASSGPPPAFTTWTTEVSSTLTPVLPALQSLSEHITSLPGVQQKVVKSLMSELYEGLVQDLGLQETLEKQSAAASAEDGAAAAPDIDPLQSAHLTAIQTRVRGLVGGFVEKNQQEARGTLASVMGAWKQSFLPAIQPLVNPEGVFAETRIRAVTTAVASHAGNGGNFTGASSAELEKLRSQLSRAQRDFAEQQKKLEAANKTLQETIQSQKKALSELDTKHTALVMKHVDLEESNTKLSAQNNDLSKKAQMCTVFEAGLTDMRTMLEQEIESKNQIQLAWDHLSAFQRNHKLTWLPDKMATHCMKCQSKFSMFGSKSKGHCRYCGRIFCKDCCTECPIPEFGYTKKVKICKPCFSFRAKVQDENAREAADEVADEEDEEEDTKPSPVASSSSKSNVKGGKSVPAPGNGSAKKGPSQPSGLLSFSDDEDDI